MRQIIIVLAAAALAGCGVDVATSAATVASLKKQEMEQAKKTMDTSQQKIGQAMEQMQQSAQQRGDDK